MASYVMLRMHRSAEEAWEPFQSVPRFIPFRDASVESSNFELFIIDCLKGLSKATSLGWFDVDNFDLASYENLAKVENGGLNWIIPEKILAFVAPAAKASPHEMTVEEYVQLFRSLGVSCVIKLNKEKYDHTKFITNSINFQDLNFTDGSVPDESIVQDFLNIVQREKGAVAVHCKAGLGRTGTLIGCFVMSEFGFSALEFLGWCRICRPGSVLGPQQYFLCEFEENLEARRRKTDVMRIKSPTVPSRGEKSLFEKYRAKFGDLGQADRLMQAMKSAPASPTNIPAANPVRLGIRSYAKLTIPSNN
jgi:cell division cycle 14